MEAGRTSYYIGHSITRYMVFGSAVYAANSDTNEQELFPNVGTFPIIARVNLDYEWASQCRRMSNDDASLCHKTEKHLNIKDSTLMY